MIVFVSDVHGAFGPLGRLVRRGDPVVILGDLANLTDYRTGEGAVAEVLGIEFAREAARARGWNDYGAMRALWSDHVGDRIEDVRVDIGKAISTQYERAAAELDGGEGWVIHGNVDHPEALVACLPESFEYAHGATVEAEGLRIGLVGGGTVTPLRARGEVSDDDMERMLHDLGPVDVLCTHVPAAVRALRHDVVTGRQERGSEPVLGYIRRHRPKYHLFGDVHQAQATTWRVGPTICLNAGYFRATGRFLALRDGVVRAGRIG
ncbi:MAG: metallophosphoesterase [Acidimicrobiia bacterium]|nr:metallophosphoesterase [Acidimicrobiia bacterium]